MRRELALSLLALLLISGCSEGKQEKSVNEQTNAVVVQPSPATEQKEIKQEILAEGLNAPWAIEKNGSAFYITERSGAIVQVEAGEVKRQNVELKKRLATASEAGLLGFALSPDFLESNLAYAYYTYTDESGQFNRIVTLRLEEETWREESLLLDGIPSGSYHHGGRLKIGFDGKLYATTGDALEAAIAQDTSSLGGKILRLNLDGSIPSDNPFSNSYVFSYGHRNPQGLAWSPEGTLYASEHGNSANDEINSIEAGKNYGWPVIEGHESKEGMVSPLFTSGAETTWAPSGMAFSHQKLYVAALRGTALLEFNLEANEQRTIISGLGRIRDVFIEDNVLYFVSNNTDGRGSSQNNDDKLYKILLDV